MSNSIEAGRELDALVAQRIWGGEVRWLNASADMECGDWSVCPFCHPADGSTPEPCIQADRELPQPCYQPAGSKNPNFWKVCPSYSASIEAAWQVLERFLFWNVQRVNAAPWAPFFYSVNVRVDGATDEEHEGNASAETAPLAICRAALAAVSPFTETSVAPTRASGEKEG